MEVIGMSLEWAEAKEEELLAKGVDPVLAKEAALIAFALMAPVEAKVQRIKAETER